MTPPSPASTISASPSPTASSLQRRGRRLGQPDRAAARLPADPPDVAARRRRPRRRPHRDLPRPARLRRQRQARRDATPTTLLQAHHGRRHRRARPCARATSVSRWPGTTAARWSRSAPASTTPDAITHLACLDVLPTLDMWDVMHGANAAVGFHLYLMAQPPGLPEQMIARQRRTPSSATSSTSGPTTRRRSPPTIRAAYLERLRDAVPSIVADYRASAGIDVDHDRADRDAGNQLRMPVTVAPAGLGRRPRLRRRRAVARLGARPARTPPSTCGHFMAEEAPADVVKALRDLLARC